MIVLFWANLACRLIVGIAILVMVFSIFGQVFYRNVLDSYLGWAEEVARYAFVWLVFLGSASAFRDRLHLGIDFVPEMMGYRSRIILDTLVCVVVLGLMVVLSYYGYQLTLRTMTQISPSTGIIMGYIYMAIPIGSGLIAIYAVVDIARNVFALASGDLDRSAVKRPVLDPSHQELGA